MTQQFQSSKFLIEAGPVNWYEPHAEAVAKRNQQEEKAAAEFEAHTNQKLKVYKEEDPLLKLAAISKTIQAAAKLTSATAKKVKAEKEEKDKENRTKVADLQTRYNIGDKDIAVIADTYRDYKGPRNKIFTEANKKFKAFNEHFKGEEYKGLLDELRTMGPRMQILLQESSSIRESHRISDINAYENSKEWKEKYDSKDSPLTVKDWNDKKPDKQQLEHKAWWHDRISSMGNSDELTRKYMGSELSRAASTKKNIDLAKTSFRLNKKNYAIAEGFGLTKGNSLDSSELPQFFYDETLQVLQTENLKDIEGGPTALEQAAAIVRERFRAINKSGYIPRLGVQDFRNFKFKHPAGKKGYANLAEAFFKGKEDFFTEIVQDNEIGQKRYLAVQSTLDNKYAAELLEQGGLGKMSKEDFDVAVLNLKSRGNLSAQMITALERIDPTLQSTSIAESEQQNFDEIFATGRSSNFDDAITGYTQNSVKTAAKNTKNEYVAFRAKVGIDQKSSESGTNSDDWALNEVDGTLGLKLPPNSALKLGEQRTAQRIISQIRDEEAAKQFLIAKQEGTLSDKKHLSAVNVNTKARLTELGFYVKDKTKDPNVGPLTPHGTEGRFPGLKSYDEAIVEAGKESRIGSDWPVVKQEAAVITSHILKSGIPSALNEKGLIVKNPEFLGLLNNVDPSDRITSWPPDLILKAEMIGVAPGVIAARQLESLLSSTDQDDIDYVKLHQLDKLTPILAKYDQADAKWRQFLRDINDPYLPPGMNLSRLTDSQIRRIRQYEQQIMFKDTDQWNLPKLGTEPIGNLENTPQIEFDNQEDSKNLEFNTNTN